MYIFYDGYCDINKIQNGFRNLLVLKYFKKI